MTDSKHSYAEPAVLWRLEHPDGRKARAVVVPRGLDTCAVWFINEWPGEARDFIDWDTALRWLDETRTMLEENSWRCAD